MAQIPDYGPFLFEPGSIAATPGIMALNLGPHLLDCLYRHLAGDWGNVSAEDAAANQAAVSEGTRILSAYPIDPALPCRGYGDTCIWIITEADRSRTTVLLPDEY